MRARASMTAIALGLLVALLALGGVARAENECGAPEPGVEIVCSLSTYDPDTDGNIFYGPDESNTDFTIRLDGDLTIDYDRENPGDDFYINPSYPDEPTYAAIWITPTETGYGYTGDISVFSSADVTSNARGITVGHYGESGALRLELMGGHFTTMGERGRAVHGHHEGAGNIDIIARNLTVNTDGLRSYAISSVHGGAGDVNLNVRGATLATMGVRAYGLAGFHTGVGDINVGVQGLTVNTMGDNAPALYAQHDGAGAINLDVRGATLATMGVRAYGLSGLHLDAGDINIDARNLVVNTMGDNATALFVQQSGAGAINLDVRDATLATMNDDAHGLFGLHFDDGDINVGVQGLTVNTMGDNADSLFVFHGGMGDIALDVRGATLATMGVRAEGIRAQHSGERGHVNLDVRDTTFATMNDDAYGIVGFRDGVGDINLDVRDTTFATMNDGTYGIVGFHAGVGDINFDVRGATLATMGANSYGIYGLHDNPPDHIDNPADSDNNLIQGTGDITISMTGGEINTQGDGSHGIFAKHEPGLGEIRITVDGGTINASGVGASGIQIGGLGKDGIVVAAAALGEDGYHRQSVTVNGRVWGGAGEAAGVYLAGGGRVMIGPQGSLGAESGVAIRAAGDVLDSAGTPRKPKLSLDANLAGRRMASVIQGDVQNDGGETTIVVNGVKLYAAAGATGLEVLNGAWDLTLHGRERLAGRAFSANDVVEVYAPRAAVYEALPGLLLRLNSRGPAGERLTAPGSPAWVRVAGGAGRYAAVQASVGAKYNFRRIEVEAGLDVDLGPRLTGLLSVRHVQGSGDVSSPTGGGEINARGLGGAIGVAWTGPRGYYFQSRLSVIDYDVDLASDTRGTLTKDASAVGLSLGFETGRRFTLSERIRLTPRVWLTRSKIDFDFTDAVQSQLSTKDSDRLTAGTGLVAETECVWDDGAQAFAVRGSLDLWRTLGDGTALNVSQGAPLQSVSDKTRVLVSLGGVYRWGRFSVSSEVAAGGPGSRDQEYAGFLNLGIQF